MSNTVRRVGNHSASEQKCIYNVTFIIVFTTGVSVFFKERKGCGEVCCMEVFASPGKV